MSIDRIHLNNHGIDNHPALDRTEEAPKNDSAPRPRQYGSSAPEDSVALSSKAREIEHLTSRAGAARAARMEEIRAAIENGTYEVPGEAVARKMIAAHAK